MVEGKPQYIEKNTVKVGNVSVSYPIIATPSPYLILRMANT